MNEYEKIIEKKSFAVRASGFDVSIDSINLVLYDWQRATVCWAINKGRSLVGYDAGLGKTLIQCEWARIVSEHTNSPVLIVAPLSVTSQTVARTRDLGICSVVFIRSEAGVDYSRAGVYITNYETARLFSFSGFSGIVLDESSILKHVGAKTRDVLIDRCSHIKYKLCCSATQFPNDPIELGGAAEFLGIATTNEMKSTFFIHANKTEEIAIRLHDGKGVKVRNKKSNKSGQEWRLRNHAIPAFCEWVSSWARFAMHPSDLGNYSDDGYVLPELIIEEISVESEYCSDDQLFFTKLSGITERANVRKATLDKKVRYIANRVNNSSEQYIIWCGLNDEANALNALIPDSVNVSGADSIDFKRDAFDKFASGEIRVMITKTKIAGMGMDWQFCYNIIFCGINDSIESFYQAVRRCLRYGQSHNVRVVIVTADVEESILANMKRKDAMFISSIREFIEHIKKYGEEGHFVNQIQNARDYHEWDVKTDKYTLLVGDAALRLRDIPDESVGIIISSPPFLRLFTYSPSKFDLSNCRNVQSFFSQFRYIVREFARVLSPGRLVVLHVSDVPAMLIRDGYIGLRDFPGMVTRMMWSCGFALRGRVIIPKNPQAQSIRTHAQRLAFGQLEKNSVLSGPALLDQMLVFSQLHYDKRAMIPVNAKKNGEITNDEWITWASGLWGDRDYYYQIWPDIDEGDILRNYTKAKDLEDEQHVCPLQLKPIERWIKLGTNLGDIVLDPFGGIGSVGHAALCLNRRAIIIELKESYARIAQRNLENASAQQLDIFSWYKSQSDLMREAMEVQS